MTQNSLITACTQHTQYSLITACTQHTQYSLITACTRHTQYSLITACTHHTQYSPITACTQHTQYSLITACTQHKILISAAISNNVSITDTRYCRPNRSQVAAVYGLNGNGSISERQLHPAGLPVHNGHADRVRIRSVHRSVPHQKESPTADGQIGQVAPCKWSWLDKPVLLHQKEGSARHHDQRSGHF
jgi:hypothetical protein